MISNPDLIPHAFLILFRSNQYVCIINADSRVSCQLGNESAEDTPPFTNETCFHPPIFKQFLGLKKKKNTGWKYSF